MWLTRFCQSLQLICGHRWRNGRKLAKDSTGIRDNDVREKMTKIMRTSGNSKHLGKPRNVQASLTLLFKLDLLFPTFFPIIQHHRTFFTSIFYSLHELTVTGNDLTTMKRENIFQSFCTEYLHELELNSTSLINSFRGNIVDRIFKLHHRLSMIYRSLCHRMQHVQDING